MWRRCPQWSRSPEMHRQKLQAKLGNRARAMPRAQFPLAATPAMHSRAKMPASIRTCRQRSRQILKCLWPAKWENAAIASLDRLSVSHHLYVAVERRQPEDGSLSSFSLIAAAPTPLCQNRRARLSFLIIAHVGIFRFVAELGRKF